MSAAHRTRSDSRRGRRDALARVAPGVVVELGEQELARLLDEAELVAERDTGLAGPIRVLALGERVLVQERNQQHELFVREFESLSEAQDFVDERLATYDRMWDGCGCRIDYRR
jgi:hypothetical protein